MARHIPLLERHAGVSLDFSAVGEPDRRYLMMSGYLQNGEAIIMKKATLRWSDEIRNTIQGSDIRLVNFVHDEWQIETSADRELYEWRKSSPNRSMMWARS
jgi:hypothetical protein